MIIWSIWIILNLIVWLSGASLGSKAGALNTRDAYIGAGILISISCIIPFILHMLTI